MDHKVIVAHPGRQHSFRLASALYKSNMLQSYVTTIYNKHDSFMLSIFKRFLSKDNQKRANGRRNSDLPDEIVVQYGEFMGFVEAFLARVDKTHEVYRFFQRHDADRFGIRVAKLAIKQNTDAVVMYDSNATAGFRYLKKHAPNIKRILDFSIAARPYMKTIYEKEIERSGHDDLKRDNQYMWNKKLLSRMQQEIDESQYFLVASSFVKESLMYCGVQDSQIKIVPYGANVSSSVMRDALKEGTRIEFLFVGQVNYRKGVPYILSAIENVPNSHLTVTGSYNSEDWFIKQATTSDKVSFTGLVTIDKMREIYENADVFVIPSFAEGMAQVGIEAMACGLPIICTHNSGVADLVTDGKNGFIIEAGNEEQLREKMQWFVDHPDQIVEMGRLAKKVAQEYSWTAYEKNVVNAMRDVICGNH